MIEISPEKKIGKYIILKRLGRGGMGYVYHAFDPLIKRDVAIKIIHPDMAEDLMLIERFKREAQSAGGLRHPNIVTIYDLGEDNDRPYIAMEFLEGTDLEHLIRTKADIPLDKKIDVIAQVCEGLDYAHKHGIVHRDITPSNIRILDNGLVKIMDFGIAKITSQQITQTGTLMGKPHYMAPEQVRGETVDGRTDIFALGVCLYEFLCYRKPFPGENTTSVLLKIISDAPDPLTDIQYTANPQLEAIIYKALSKDANKRFQTAKEMAEVLKDFLPTTRVTKVTTTIPSEIQETVLTPPKIESKTGSQKAVKTDSVVQTIQTLPTLQKEPTGEQEVPTKLSSTPSSMEMPTKLFTSAKGQKIEPTVAPTKLSTPATDAKIDSSIYPTQLSTPSKGSQLDSTAAPTQLSSPAAGTRIDSASLYDSAQQPPEVFTQVIAPPKAAPTTLIIVLAIVFIAIAAGGFFIYKNYIQSPTTKTGTTEIPGGNTSTTITEPPVEPPPNTNNQTNQTDQNNQINPNNNQNKPEEPPPTIISPDTNKLAAQGFLKLNVLPWAKISKIKNETTDQIKYPDNLYTPCFLPLEPGNYSMVVNNVELNKNQTLTFIVTSAEITELNYKFQLYSGFSDEELIKEQ